MLLSLNSIPKDVKESAEGASGKGFFTLKKDTQEKAFLFETWPYLGVMPENAA